MIQAYDYIVSNWNKYGLNCTRNEFIALINILEANNENLSSFHDVCFNGYDNFCGIYGSFDNDNDLMKVLFDFHFFIPKQDFKKWLIDRTIDYIDNNSFYPSNYKYDFSDFLQDVKKDFMSDINDIIETHDGYVLKLYY